MFHPLHYDEAKRLDLALTRGIKSGRQYGDALLQPACTMKRPRNPYWCPVRRFVWDLGFALGVYDSVNFLTTSLDNQ
jgi:hypothetical protein